MLKKKKKKKTKENNTKEKKRKEKKRKEQMNQGRESWVRLEGGKSVLKMCSGGKND